MSDSEPTRHSAPPADARPPDAPPGLGPIQAPPPPPGSSNKPLLALLIGGLLLAVAVTAGVVLLGGSPASSPSPTPTAVAPPPPSPTRGPVASPTGPPSTPSPSPTMPTPSPAAPATPLDPGDVARLIDEVVAQVPPIRELEPLADVPYELISREDFEASLSELIYEETTPEELATQGRLLERLGLLPAGADLPGLIEELYGSQVAAYYRPDTGTFYVIERDEPFGAMDRMTVAHEYAHALQDQHFGLEESRITDPAEGDAVLAQVAAIEGDAVLVMSLWAFEHLTPVEWMALMGESMSPADEELLESMPPILRRQLEFPYVEGTVFVGELFADGGWSAINDALVTPPATTEQVLHPAKYFAGEEAVRVRVDDLSDVLGGWQRVHEETLGELNVGVWLAGGEEPEQQLPGLPAVWPHADGAAGWGGDRLVMYEADAPDGWAIVWHIAWDSAGDADDFEARAGQLLRGLAGEALVVRLDALNVALLVASDADALAALEDAIGD